MILRTYQAKNTWYHFLLFLFLLSLHLEDICHVCRPVFECAYKVYEIKTGRPCSTHWFKEHQEEIYSFLICMAIYIFLWLHNLTTTQNSDITSLTRTHIFSGLWNSKCIGAKLLADFSLIFTRISIGEYIISLSKRNKKLFYHLMLWVCVSWNRCTLTSPCMIK